MCDTAETVHRPVFFFDGTPHALERCLALLDTLAAPARREHHGERDEHVEIVLHVLFETRRQFFEIGIAMASDHDVRDAYLLLVAVDDVFTAIRPAQSGMF